MIRIHYNILAVVTAVSTAGIVTGCSTAVPGLSSAATEPAATYSDAKRLLEQRRAVPFLQGKTQPGNLYVSTGSTSAGSQIQVFANGSYKPVDTIPDANQAFGLSIDDTGDLYAANTYGGSVEEYPSGSSQPKCTYTTDLNNPISVTTNAQGRVEISNLYFGAGSYGWIAEFAHCKNKILRERMLPGAGQGIAIDASGDIFVSYITAAGTGSVVEYIKGSNKATVLGVSLKYAGGIAIDNKGNLLMDDQDAGTIDISSPPYQTSKVIVTVTGHPIKLALNRSNSLLFSSNYYGGTVTIYAYPSGKLLKTIAVSSPSGIVDSPSESQQ